MTNNVLTDDLFRGDGAAISLQLADWGDLENLRVWKNIERNYFFYNQEINAEQQQAWFNEYLTRQNDYMYIVKLGDYSVGCMGIRQLGGEWDVYNVILGIKEYGGRGIMAIAFSAMLRAAMDVAVLPISLKVLKCNPAVGWYIKQKFVVTEEHSTYYKMKYNPVGEKEGA